VELDNNRQAHDRCPTGNMAAESESHHQNHEMMLNAKTVPFLVLLSVFVEWSGTRFLGSQHKNVLYLQVSVCCLVCAFSFYCEFSMKIS
jgi:hypothetical protein